MLLILVTYILSLSVVFCFCSVGSSCLDGVLGIVVYSVYEYFGTCRLHNMNKCRQKRGRSMVGNVPLPRRKLIW